MPHAPHPPHALRSPAPDKVRLQRVMADAGVAARRACEAMIEEGRVSVNGQIVSRLPVFVDPHEDRIVVNGRPLGKPERLLYLMLHKPPRSLVTSADEPGLDRVTVMDFVDHPSKARLFPVGRLDFDTSGLLLLTNDGELTHKLTHPRFGITKTYLVTIKGGADDGLVSAIGRKIGAVEQRAAREDPARSLKPSTRPRVSIVKSGGHKTMLEVTLFEARNRQIEEILAHMGAPVRKIVRVAVGPVHLKGLAVGLWRELERDEIQALRRAAAGRPATRRANPRTSKHGRREPAPRRRGRHRSP